MFIAVDRDGKLYLTRYIQEKWEIDLIPRIKGWQRLKGFTQVNTTSISDVSEPSMSLLKNIAEENRNGSGWAILGFDSRCRFSHIRPLLELLLNLGEQGVVLLVNPPTAESESGYPSKQVSSGFGFGFHLPDGQLIWIPVGGENAPIISTLYLNLVGKPQEDQDIIRLFLEARGHFRLAHIPEVGEPLVGSVKDFCVRMAELSKRVPVDRIVVSVDGEMTTQDLVTVLDVLGQNGVTVGYIDVTSL